MNLTVICQNQEITAQELTDRVGSARKVMLDAALPVGAVAEIVGDGFFRVTRVLVPAAPRAWRAYLEADSTIQRLDVGNQGIPVVLLTDDPAGVKVMAVGDLAAPPTPGTTVHYQQKTYTIQRVLAPAAPRGWRFYLQAVTEPGEAPTAPANSPETGSKTLAEPMTTSAEVRPTPSVIHASENLESVFIVEVEKLGGTNIRRSNTTLRVPYTRLSEELQRILRNGGKVVSITEGSLLR